MQLLRAAVDGLFPEEYLVARGLRDREPVQHNDVVTEALEVLLSRWERMALIANVAPDRAEEMRESTGLLHGFWEDLAVRLAAYELLFGHLHAFVSELPKWLLQPKLKACWASLEARSSGRMKVSKLYENGQLDSKTMRDLRDGKTLPKESTLAPLADRLAAVGIQDRIEPRKALPCEVLFELRVATAFADEAALVARVFGAASEGALSTMHVVLRSLLRTAPDQRLHDLLRWGIQAPQWPRLRKTLVSVGAEAVNRGMAKARSSGVRAVERAGGDMSLVAADLAASSAEQLASLRAMPRRAGEDGPELRWMEFFEYQRELARFYQGARSEFPAFREGFSEELEADCLYFDVLGDPSLPEAQQERKLREAVAVCERSASAHRVLAHWLAERDEVAEALHHYRRAYAINPANVEGRERLLELLARKGAVVEALAVPAAEMSVLYLGIRAVCLAEAGDFPAARALASSILADHPRHPTALRALAHCYRAEGNETTARRLERDARFYDEGVGVPGK